jgi:hypothetical protein
VGERKRERERKRLSDDGWKLKNYHMSTRESTRACARAIESERKKKSGGGGVGGWRGREREVP